MEYPNEYKELRKSIFYNLALIYKERGESRSSLFFLFSYYKLNPENINVISEIAILCRKEGLVEQSLYFFHLAHSKDASASMKLIYLEQIIVMNFILGNYDTCLEKIAYIIRCNYKVSEMLEMREHISSILSRKEELDFFSEHYKSPYELSANLGSEKAGVYLTKVIELKQSYVLKKTKLAGSSSSWKMSEEPIAQRPVGIRIPKLKWKGLLSSIITIIKIHNHRQKHLTPQELKAKIDGFSASKLLSTTQFDIFEDLFEVSLEDETDLLDHYVERLEKKSESPESTKEMHNKPREERYSGGQMALREKKMTSKAQSETAPENFKQGFDCCLQRLLQHFLEKESYDFVQKEISIIFDISTHLKKFADQQVAYYKPGKE